jgi:hypothetical protein
MWFDLKLTPMSIKLMVAADLVVVLGTAELAVVFESGGARGGARGVGAALPVIVHGIADFVVVVGAAVLKSFRMARHVLEL